MKHFSFLFLLLCLLIAGCTEAHRPAGSELVFHIRAKEGLLPDAREGRLFVILSKDFRYEPRWLFALEDLPEKPIGIARDLRFTSGDVAVLGDDSSTFPVRQLSEIHPGTYLVQAVFMQNRDMLGVNSPGNLFSSPRKIFVNPAGNDAIEIELMNAVTEDNPLDSPDLKYIKLKSQLLSDFHGRPMYLRAGVILPRNYEKEVGVYYPLWIHIGGGESNFMRIAYMMNPQGNYWEIPHFRETWLSEQSPKMIFVHLDNRGPYGCPYHVNSANNGPYGDAIVRELIPYIEKQYRGIGKPFARFLEGRSTGGWSALALQIFYPDYFNGAWAGQPDPVDFRAYLNIDIYRDANAYRDKDGTRRSSARNGAGISISDVETECRRENMLGFGNSYTQSAGTWGAWNAVFSPRAKDGRPLPLWDEKSGALDGRVAEHFKNYDLRLYLQSHWPEIADRLKGKLHVWVGDLDTYYLNRAVHYLDDFLSHANPPYGGYIEFGPGQSHTWSPKSAGDLMTEMKMALEKSAPKEGE